MLSWLRKGIRHPFHKKALKQRRLMSEKHKQPIKSLSDVTRQYKAFQLENKIDVLVVSEPTTDKAGAAMDVSVGSYNDPEEFFGLAHFLEHMLFLGTKKYPTENYYGEFLSKNGGRSNAYTSSESTNYYFDVTKENLKTALDIFAQFFIAPLFTESGTDREMNAVDSENKKNLQDDNRRLRQVLKSEASPLSPFSKFSTGNLETLNKDGVRTNLINFHEKYYSANLMKLCILGAEPLETLESWAREIFSEIPNKNYSRISFSHVPTFTQLPLSLYCVPVKLQRSLLLYWPLKRSYHAEYKKKPSRYFSHLLGHESDGSVYALIKKKGWATGLSAGQHSQTRDSEIFGVKVVLTEEGMDHRDEIISIIYEYIDILHKSEPTEWIYKELQEMSTINFQYAAKKEPYNFVTDTASDMQDYPSEHYLNGSHICIEFDSDLIKEYGQNLVPSNMIVVNIAKKFESECNLSEKWYGTKYKKSPIDQTLIDKWTHPVRNYPSDLYLPSPNPFVPSKLELKPHIPKTEQEKNSTKEDAPILLLENGKMKLWCLQDRTFEIPKSHVSIQFITPQVSCSPHNIVKTQMIASLIKDELNEFTYYADVAGLYFNLHYSWEGLELQLWGYDEKITVLLEKILGKLVSLDIKPERFDVHKIVRKEEYENFFKGQPYSHATYYLNQATVEPSWSIEGRLKIIESLTVDELRKFFPVVLSDMFINVFVHGNSTSSDAQKLAEKISEIVSHNIIFESQWPRQRSVQLKNGISYVVTEKVPNPADENSAIFTWFPTHLEDESRDTALLYLMSDMLKEQCYDQLRTKEQLGYIVWSGARSAGGLEGWRVVVQSSVKDPIYLNQRIENFIENSKNLLDQLPESEFQKFVTARIVKFLEKEHSLKELHQKYWDEVKCWKYKFYKNQELAEITKTLSLNDLRNFFTQKIYDRKTRCNITSRVFGKKHPLVLEDAREGLVNVTDPIKFRNSLPLNPIFISE